MSDKTHLQEKLAHLPKKPGVYQHKDAEGTVLYVGKAKNLRNRVRSYFHRSRPRDGRIAALVRRVEDVEVIVTDTEAEALILENNLIKRLKPRYNVNLKDDKTYPYICIKNERFPRVFPTRRLKKDGSEYFGPYTDVKNMKRVLGTVRKIFKLRTCKLLLNPKAIEAGKYDACLEYHIKKCAAPCVGYQSEEDYDATIEQVRQLLNGKTSTLIGRLKKGMTEAAAAMEFERAAELRDQVRALQTYTAKQKIVSQEDVDRDLFALCVSREDKVAVGVLFKVREGKVIGRRHRYLRGIQGVGDEDLMQSLLEDHYAEATFFPDEVHVNVAPASDEALLELLRREKGRIVPIKAPQRGEKAGMIRMVEANAELLLGEWKIQQVKRGEARIPHSVKALQEALRLKKLPRRIECFDISHLGGTGTVASCVVFQDGKPRKSDYRTYNIRTVEKGKPDDYQSMREVVGRRYSRTLEENGPWPDLVIIDGGKGQLSAAVEALQGADVYGRFPVVGLAKRLEEVFFPGERDPRLIGKTNAGLQLIQRTRDEAHRFAVTHQRKQRKKGLRSELLDIEGVGPKTARKLLTEFGSVERVRQADEAALVEVVGPSVAGRVRAYFEAKEAA